MSNIKISWDDVRVGKWDEEGEDGVEAPNYRGPGDSLHLRGGVPGSACWCPGQDGEVACLRFVCPCGCEAIVSVPVKAGYANGHWTWNGDKERPTLTPSILRTAGCRWHGFLTDGEFRTC